MLLLFSFSFRPRMLAQSLLYSIVLVFVGGIGTRSSLAQTWTNAEDNDLGLGLKAGLSYQLGTQGNRLGLTASGFAQNRPTNTSLSVSWSGYRTISQIQTDEPGWEQQLTLGVTQGLGKKRDQPNPYDWSLAANNTQRHHSLSLYSTLYRDSYGTSQRVGGLGIEINRVGLRFENDYSPFGILGDRGDRFRTAALELGYRSDERTRWVTGFNLFTGDILQGTKLEVKEGGPLPYGIYSLEQEDGRPVDAVERSIGNAYVGVRGLTLGDSDNDLSQFLGTDNLQLRAGWSSEAIRDGIQNRFHDLIRNPRVPTQNTKGRFYLEAGTNSSQTLYP